MEIQEDSQEESEEDSDKEDVLREMTVLVEEAVVSMFNTKQNKTMKIMKFKDEIDQVPVCALLDSDNTYSFVNPSILHKKIV
jgi:hypothetical protein